MAGRAGYENVGIEMGHLVDPNRIPDFLELAEDYPDEHELFLNQNNVRHKGISADQQHWREHGYLIKRNFIPHELIDEYNLIRKKLDLGDGPFESITPYLNHSTIRDICCSKDLHYLLVDLIGEEMGLHFILADYVSTTRGWHQDDYLNPENTYARYCAVWMAMDDIDPDSGPFEFVPGSHKWPCLRNNLVKELIIPEQRETGGHHWAVAAEYHVNKSVENYIEHTGSRVEKFDAKKGDILIWHGKLMHRGSIPRNKDLMRPAMISHYSNIRNRRDFSNEITRHLDGGYYFEFSDLGRPLTGDVFDRNQLSAEAKGPGEPNAQSSRPATDDHAGFGQKIRKLFNANL